jgi:hypothetical protein
MIIELALPPAQSYGGQSTKIILGHILKAETRSQNGLFFQLRASSYFLA